MFVGLPYGARARLILIFLQGEAVARGREVALGDSLSAWMRSLGIAPSSGPRGAIASVREQALRIGLCSFSVQWDGVDAAGNQVISLRDVPIVEGLEMAAKPGTSGVWPKSVFLGQAFYEHLRQHAVPLDKRAIAYLSGNSLGLDLYALFAYRLPRLKGELRLSWEAMQGQIGSEYTQMRDLARHVRSVMPDIKVAYPHANVEVGKGGLLLRPSKPSVPRNQVNGFKLLES
jgi:hypothetical protein